MKGEPLTYIDSLLNWWDHNKTIGGIRAFLYKLKVFFSNLPLFIKFAWGFRAWDSTYSMEIYVALLEEHGKNIRKYGHALSTEKTARKAFTMAGMLRKAYLENVPNKTSLYLYKKNGYRFMGDVPVTPERILEGMRKVSNDREEVTEARLKRDAMLYWYKYIEHVWD
jgi:hypothetical protein